MTVKQHTVLSAESNKALNASRLSWDDYCHSRPDISKLGLRLCKKLASKYVCKSKSAATFAATGMMFVNPSQLGLATDLKCSRRNVRKGLRNLLAVKVLRIRSPGGVGGRGNNTEYEMIIPAQEGAPLEQKKGHQEGALKGHLFGTERGTDQVQEGAPRSATSFSLTKASLINSQRSAPTKNKNSDLKAGSISEPVASTPPTPPPHSEPVDLQALEVMWPRKNQDAAALVLTWKRVLDSGVDAAFVLKQGDRWCLWWSSTGAPANKIPHLGQWLSYGGFRKAPPFDASYPEKYARMLRDSSKEAEGEPEPFEPDWAELARLDPDLLQFRELLGDPVEPSPSAPTLTWEMVAANNLDWEDAETRQQIKAILARGML